jgi:2-polyprenyl-3-methyl-5-hydroxy-6-metoxy-1,4-benzoquinol methylase
MFRYRLRQARDGIRRLLRVNTLTEHEEVLGELRALSARVDAMARLAEAEAAVDLAGRLERLERIGPAIEASLQGLETRLTEAVFAPLRSDVGEIAAGLKEYLETIKGTGLDRWRIREYEGLLRYFRRQEYFRAIRSGRLAVPRLETEHPLAVSSNDTKFPRGSKNDNSILGRFNRKLYQFLGDRPGLRVLDLGCAGGGFVRSLIDDGHFAVGLEGSDYPILNQVSEWPTIPLHLFTCDITQPFRLSDKQTDEPLLFDAITAWEVMEHIPEEGLPGLLENLDRHLAPGGFLLFSIATFLDWDYKTGTIWHNTVRPREWWEERFAQLGFAVEEGHPFGKEDWLRGSGQCRGDWHEDQGLGFHIVLKRKSARGAAAGDGVVWRESA